MLELFIANLPTILVAAIVFGAAGLAAYKLYRDSKAGKGKCTGNCATCGGCSHHSDAAHTTR